MDFHYFRRSLASECSFRVDVDGARWRAPYIRLSSCGLLFPLVVVVAKGRAGRGEAAVGGGRCERKNPEKAKARECNLMNPLQCAKS